MVRLKQWWRGFVNVAIAISVIFNLIFIVVLLFVVMLLFDLKVGLVQPLVNGLHSSFVGLDESTIIATVLVDDIVPVKLNIPYSTNTTVRLTSPVPIRANATFNLPGGGGTINGAVSIVLPQGLDLPVALNLNVPVNDTLPVKLKVPVNIRIKDTQLHDPIDQLRLVLDPFVRLLNNLPNSWPEFWGFAAKVATGQGPDIFAPNKQSISPWPGFRTGLGTPIPISTPTGEPANPGTGQPQPPAANSTLPPPPSANPGNGGGLPTAVPIQPAQPTPQPPAATPPPPAQPAGGGPAVAPTVTPSS
jgi:hypothetical protein